MKITLRTKDLRRALPLVRSCISRHTTLPVLTCIHMEARDGELILSTSDLERWMETRIPAEIEEPGILILSGRRMAEVIKCTPESTIAISGIGTATIEAGPATYTVIGYHQDEFLPQPPIAPTVDFTMKQGELAKALA